MIRNPSEYVRLEEELEHYKRMLRQTWLHKKTRAAALSEARRIAGQLDIVIPDYNSEAFSDWLRK